MNKPLIFAGVALGLALALSGCGGDEHPRAHGDRETMGQPPSPQPVMSGQETFFAGKFLVEATLSRGLRHGDETGEDHGSTHRGGGGGGHRHHGAAGGEAGGGESGGSLAVHESPMPPISLAIRVTNQSDAPIEVGFDGCDSALGNFVVSPEKATIPAQQSFSIDPMRSLLGNPADAIPIDFSLRVGGKTEHKTITLRLVQPMPPPLREEAPTPAPNAQSTPAAP